MVRTNRGPKFKTASWQGVVRPDWSPATDLVTMTIRLPKELDDDVEVAVKKYADWFESKEEFLVTAAAFAIQNLAEHPPPIRMTKTDGGRRRNVRRRSDSDRTVVSSRRLQLPTGGALRSK